MADRGSNKAKVVGIIVLLCGILMVVLQIAGGEKLHLGTAVVFLCLGTVLVAVSHRRRADK